MVISQNDHSYWIKQTLDSPLSPELLWSRPESKSRAGKLAIIGGHGHGFQSVAASYNAAKQAGAGSVRTLLPNSLISILKPVFPQAEYAPSNLSGALSMAALDPSLELAGWADGVLLPGDLGRNSETAIWAESFATKFTGRLTIAQDSCELLEGSAKWLLNRPDTTLVMTLEQLQRLVSAAHWTEPITSSGSLVQLVERLHNLTGAYQANIITKNLDYILFAEKGMVGSIKSKIGGSVWSITAAAWAAVWWLQNPDRSFIAIFSALEQAKV